MSISVAGKKKPPEIADPGRCRRSASRLSPDEVSSLTGHAVGGVCPFGLATSLPILCDVSLRDFPIVFPAAGSQTSSIKVAPERLATLVGARWVHVCSPTSPEG